MSNMFNYLLILILWSLALYGSLLLKKRVSLSSIYKNFIESFKCLLQTSQSMRVLKKKIDSYNHNAFTFLLNILFIVIPSFPALAVSLQLSLKIEIITLLFSLYTVALFLL